MNDNNKNLTTNEKIRYNRQIVLSDWGREGQLKLKKATVFIAGAGGLGSSVCIYLAAAGVGCLRVCDFGNVELSNLNRQILHSDSDIGQKKIISAKRTLSGVNPHAKLVYLDDKITKTTIAALVDNADIIIDCLDNFETRYIINEYVVKTGLPFIHAGVYGMSGQVTFIHPPQTPCLRCIFPDAPAIEIIPVVGAAPGMIGCLEVQEALKYLTGRGTVLKNRLLIWDGDSATFEEFTVEKSPHVLYVEAGNLPDTKINNRRGVIPSMSKKEYILAIDQGTTGTGVILFNHDCEIHAMAYREINPIYPKPGCVEHDPREIWNSVMYCCEGVFNQGNVFPEEWESIEELEQHFRVEKIFEPKMGENQREELYGNWKRTVERSLKWEKG